MEDIVIPIVGMFVPIAIVGIVFWAITQRRKLEHQERLAMIEKGMMPEQMKELATMPLLVPRTRGLHGSVTTAAVGLALLIGMYTIGVGPWLLAGLIPLAVGLGGIITYLITSSEGQKKDTESH